MRPDGNPTEQLDRARIEALRLVGSVIEAMGDDAPAALVDAHRVLATGCTDAERPEQWTTARDSGNPLVTEHGASRFHIRPASQPMAPKNSVGRLLWLAEIVGGTPRSVTEEGARELAEGVEHLLVALDKIAHHASGDTGWWASNVATSALRGDRV